MKAKEHFSKRLDLFKHRDVYGVKIDEINQLIREDFIKETDELIKKQKIATNWQLVELLRMQNEKWNALVKMYNHNLGKSPIEKNEFRRRIVPKEWPSISEDVKVRFNIDISE